LREGRFLLLQLTSPPCFAFLAMLVCYFEATVQAILAITYISKATGETAPPSADKPLLSAHSLPGTMQ